MKCIRRAGEDKIKRVSDEKADGFVRNERAVYCPKTAWKAQNNKEKKSCPQK